MPQPSLKGPEKAPESGRKAQSLVIFLHGLGSNGHDLIELAGELAPLLPDTHFLSPNAPFPYAAAGFGYQWFDLYERTETAMLAGIRQAEPILNAYIDDQLARFALTDSHLALVGFSQGTMMALHTALRRSAPCAGVLGFSGALLAPARLNEDITARPPVMLVHGDADQVVPPSALPAAVEALEVAHVPVSSHRVRGLGHGINGEALQVGAAFLKQQLTF